MFLITDENAILWSTIVLFNDTEENINDNKHVKSIAAKRIDIQYSIPNSCQDAAKNNPLMIPSVRGDNQRKLCEWNVERV